MPIATSRRALALLTLLSGSLVAGRAAAAAPEAVAAVELADAATGLSTHPLFDSGDTALIAARTFQVGIFGPLRWRYDERTEISAHPLVSLVAPNAMIKRQLWQKADLTLAVRGGLGVPTGLLKLAQTRFWGDQHEFGWALSFDVAAIATWQPAAAPIALSLQVRERWAPTLIGTTDIVHNDVPLLEESVAHITDGPTTTIGLDLDLYPLEWLAIYADVELQWSAVKGPWAVDANIDLRGKLLAAVAWSPRVATSLGIMWVSSQLDRQRVTGVLPVPGLGIPMPLLDVVWRW